VKEVLKKMEKKKEYVRGKKVWDEMSSEGASRFEKKNEGLTPVTRSRNHCGVKPERFETNGMGPIRDPKRGIRKKRRRVGIKGRRSWRSIRGIPKVI